MNLRKIISKFALPNAKWLMRALAASVEALLHHTFGERYTLSLFSGLLVVAILASLVPAEKPAALMPFVTVAVFVRLLAHLVSVWRRRRTGLHVESHSSGSSWRFWSKLGLPVGIIYIFLEPLLCLAVGLVLAPVDHLFSVWLCFSGLALMLKTVIERHRTHNGMLDLLDARTAARNQRAAGHQQPNLRPDPPNNPITANAATPLTPARPLPSLFRNLDPALQRLMHDDAPRATEPLAPQPAAGGMVAASQQPTAHVSGQSSTPGRIHVRPARLQESSPPPVPLGNPRVVLVRTRPAPAPLRVRPSVPASSPLNATSEKPSSPVIGPLGTAPILHPSETVLSANIPEFAKPEHAEFTESTVLKGEAAGGRRDFDEHDTLCRQVEIEAMRLGFAVEPSGSPADLLLKRGSQSFAVEIAMGSLSGDEIESLKKCIADGLSRVAVVCPDPQRLRGLAEAVHGALTLEQAMRVSYFTPGEFNAEIGRLAAATEIRDSVSARHNGRGH